MINQDFCLEGKVMSDNADKTVKKEQNASAYIHDFHHIAAPFLTRCKGYLGSLCSTLKRSRVCVTPQIHIRIDMYKVGNTRYVLTKCEVKTSRAFLRHVFTTRRTFFPNTVHPAGRNLDMIWA